MPELPLQNKAKANVVLSVPSPVIEICAVREPELRGLRHQHVTKHTPE